jgi:hypothetical protein
VHTSRGRVSGQNSLSFLLVCTTCLIYILSPATAFPLAPAYQWRPPVYDRRLPLYLHPRPTFGDRLSMTGGCLSLYPLLALICSLTGAPIYHRRLPFLGARLPIMTGDCLSTWRPPIYDRRMPFFGRPYLSPATAFPWRPPTNYDRRLPLYLATAYL